MNICKWRNSENIYTEILCLLQAQGGKEVRGGFLAESMKTSKKDQDTIPHADPSTYRSTPQLYMDA